MNRLLALLLILFSVLTYGQTNKNTWYVSGAADFDKKQIYSIKPLIGYFFTPKDAIGITYSYENLEQKLIEEDHINLEANNLNLFYRRFFLINANTHFFLEGNIGYGRGNAKEEKNNYKLRYSNIQGEGKAGFLWFLTPRLSAEIVPFSVQYNHSEYLGKFETRTNKLSSQYSIGNKIGLNFHISNPDSPLKKTPQDLVDKKIISGRIIYSYRRNEVSQSSTSLGIAPQLDIFMTNWIQLGISFSAVSESVKGYNTKNRTTEKYSNTSLQLGPRIKVYKWLTQTTGVFAQPYLEGAFMFYQLSSDIGSHDNKLIETYGGLNIGFSSFISDRLLLEGYTTVYSIERNRFTPSLTTMNLSLGWMLGKR